MSEKIKEFIQIAAFLILLLIIYCVRSNSYAKDECPKYGHSAYSARAGLDLGPHCNSYDGRKIAITEAKEEWNAMLMTEEREKEEERKIKDDILIRELREKLKPENMEAERLRRQKMADEVSQFRYTRNTFHGYNCIGDCSGHEAGYNWAEDKSIVDPDDCGGNSNSFIEGCRAYAEENY